MNAVKRLLETEPALVRGFVVALIALLSSAGLAISDNLSEAIIGLVAAALAIVQAVSTRKNVSPVAKDEK